MTLEPIVLASLYGAIGVIGGVVAWAVLKTHEHAVIIATLRERVGAHDGKHNNHETVIDSLRATLEETNRLLQDWGSKFTMLLDGQIVIPGSPTPCRAAPRAPAKTKRR